MSVRAGVEADLATYEKRLAGVTKSGLAQAALELAERMDDADSSPTAVSNCARALNEVMDRIVAKLPPAATSDSVDELNKRRSQRRAS